MKLVSIILPVLNRPDLTKQCLDSLYASTDKQLFDLVVVDDGSNEETKKVLSELQGKYQFHMISHNESKGPGKSRNDGADYFKACFSDYKYIYHCDNDVFYKENWLEKLFSIYEVVSKDRVALLGASCHPYLQNNELRYYGTIYSEFDIEPLEIKVGIKDAVSGYSQFMSWEIWNRFGYFHTQEGLDKKTGRSDDWEYCQRIIKEGLLVGSVEPELIIPCGKTDTYGDKAVGQETFKNYEGVIIK